VNSELLNDFGGASLELPSPGSLLAPTEGVDVTDASGGVDTDVDDPVMVCPGVDCGPCLF
jgi:hypothetical protein